MAVNVSLVTMQNAAVATGAGSSLPVDGRTTAAIQVTIAGTATITFEGQVGSGTMTAMPFINLVTGAVSTTATATGIYVANVAGLSNVQARISSWSSGAVTAIGQAVDGPVGNALQTMTTSGTVTATGTVGIDQTTPNTTNRVTAALYVKTTNPGDTAALGTTAGRQLVAGGAANSAGAAITGGTVTSVDSSDTARALAVALFLYNGSTNEPMRNPNVFKVVALTAGTSETTIWTPTSGKKFRLMGFILTCGAASTLTFKDNTAGTTIFAARGTTDTPIVSVPMGNGILSVAANNVLTVTRGTSATLDGVVWGTEE